MTQLLNMPPSALAQAVLRPRAGADVSCYWCRKLLRACDGKRTVTQVAELLHLPLQVCLKLTSRAHQEGWAELSALPEESRHAAPLWDGLLEAGVIIRDVGIPGHLRVTAGTEAETTAFLVRLEELLHQGPHTL